LEGGDTHFDWAFTSTLVDLSTGATSQADLAIAFKAHGYVS
jgi:hypothetical protein